MTPQAVDIARLLDPARVLVLSGSPAKPLVITALADLATTDLGAHDRVAFIRATLEREDVTPTAIGQGIAIPHARSAAVDRCRVAVGVIAGGSRWGASDGAPVRLALLIAAREADHAEHLRVMASLAVFLRRPGLVDRVAGMAEHGDIVRAIAGE